MTLSSHRLEPLVFWALAVLHLVPVWSYRYLPTQDGPSHLNNAQIIKDYGNPEIGYDRLFEIHLDPLPNLTSHLLLAGLMYVFPPLIAEKLLVTAYLLGFAATFRYFLGGFGPDHRPLSWAGLLFVFNRCFWMGFYNYCLSLVVLWLILGFVLRRRGTLDAGGTFVLMLLFTTAYFTHLAGFLIAVGGSVLITLLAPPRRPATIGLVLLAALPAGCLTMNYLEQTGFTQSPIAMRVVRDPIDRLGGHWREDEVEKDLRELDAEVFAFHAGPRQGLGAALGVYLLVLTMLTIAVPPVRPPGSPPRPGPLFPAVFGLLLLFAYLTVPDHLGGGAHGLPNGGFLKARLALLPPLLWLACVREPSLAILRSPLRIAITVVVGLNLWLVTTTVRDGNNELARYTAGMEAVGRGHRLLAVPAGGWRSQYANPFTHAADYYCLGTGNINVDNYEAAMPHFPVKYRTDRSGMNEYDTLICWQTGGGQPGWVEIYRQGPLAIYRRPGSK